MILPDQRWARVEHRWRQVEQWGFDHAWTYDHLGWRDLVDGPWFDAVPTLTAAAAVTSRIRLGTLVASPNFRHPVSFARQVTALDDISAGRLLLGVGAGGIGFDATVLGGETLPPRRRVDRFAEFTELLDRVLRTDGTTWRGEWYAAVDARNNPGCVQRPRVPFVVAANGPRSMRLAARFGQGWVTIGADVEDLEAWWDSVAELAERFDRTLAAQGRDAATVDRYLSLDSAPVFSLSSAEFFAAQVRRAADLGFTDVITHWPRERSWYAGDEAVLTEVATSVLPEIQAS
ncbi:Flavin-dependent oxidoreductase, luciferase family (includes alkanesulfonate monooxygenase SsuD and methylene tetrahydromethanopterin reductase) [Micromonospora yangpuensis]|uniref:Flavin-dependent oxidoreductase, luciferase family (Includes alkanesulfonate monooxygenase SsuD and methylene tetrahydromethanopterin reductase) n=1 Tax=Micromonospora yangpuensis TaxID=683228 RepID=A0A1C6TX58_9ACTN|nr:Flavin-dependent oxidoreductase, luciferase family (includes alkanesulfonate monooxygenase SsuD and methylene tetrahydromethanopterin reductase) [Micromonospora yangpuensis]